jgi:hypothetical protein
MKGTHAVVVRNGRARLIGSRSRMS